jgi:beta-1,4-mannosyltransferase
VPAPGRQTNPYVVQLVDALLEHVDVRWFSWRYALFGRYDVLHVHWPEVMLRRGTPAARTAAQLRFALLLVRLAAARRITVVRTLHNLSAHESGDRLEARLLRRLDRRTDHWIALNDSDACRPPGPVSTIPHGDYAQWYDRWEVPPSVPGRLCYAGLIRPYKRVDHLLSAFAALDDPAMTLHVVGRPTTPDLDRLVRRYCTADPRIEARLEYLDDAGLARELGEAEVVVLPYAEHNSGAVLLALSLARPVLVPETAVTKALRSEVGSEWVITYAGELGPDVLNAAADAARTRSDRGANLGPDLGRRQWPEIARRHALVYRQAGSRPGPADDPDARARCTVPVGTPQGSIPRAGGRGRS